MRQIGTNAIPALLEMFRAKDPPTALLKVLKLAERQRFLRIGYRSARQRHEEAEYAFQILGTNGAFAVPELIRIYEENMTQASRTCVARALSYMGRSAAAAAPDLLRGFAHTNAEVRFSAIVAMHFIEGDPNLVVPTLTSLLKHPDVYVRWNAVSILSRTCQICPFRNSWSCSKIEP